LSSVRVVTSTAAPLSPTAKKELLAHLPANVLVVENIGSTETGFQGMSTLAGGNAAKPAAYEPRPGTVLLDGERGRVLDPVRDSRELGWIARSGHLPLGYLGDRAKTLETFPTIGGVRYALAGDRAFYDESGRIVLLGRESTCVNTGGEKVYVEEVEEVVKSHPAIRDALVVGRPSARWGQEVTAVVSLRDVAAVPTVEELRAHCAPSLAGYKLPRAVVVAPEVARLPNGKPDYEWAKRIAAVGKRGHS
jgi:acyl-CoA synthetase (AMP-forming)/AMP-acid ligase II